MSRRDHTRPGERSQRQLRAGELVRHALVDILAREDIRDPDLVAPWLTDWRGRYTGRALALAAPASTQRSTVATPTR